MKFQCLLLNLYESTLQLTTLNKRWLTKKRNSSSILFHDVPGEHWTESSGYSIKSKVKGGGGERGQGARGHVNPCGKMISAGEG